VCGRFTFARSARELAETFEVEEPLELAPRYNIAPSQEVATVRPSAGERVLEWRSWGWLPHWAKTPKDGPRSINARLETAATNPAFREASKRARCLIPADGFFEWKKRAGGSDPYRITSSSQNCFGFAGLYAHWLGPGGVVVGSFTILTQDADSSVRPLHHRMPVALAPEHFRAWLEAGPGDPIEAWGDRALRDWEYHPVDPRVNNVANDDLRCLASYQAPENLELFPS